MTDNWDFWQAALDNPKDIGKGNLAYVDDPQTGFYRVRFGNDKPWLPVAIYAHEGKMVAEVDGRPRNPASLWNSACRNPITHEAYEQALNGGGWEDDDPTVASMIGHNVGSDIDALRDQIEAAKQGAEAYAEISDDAIAGKAQSLRARMNELAGEADKRREELKKPHFEAGKAIDAEYMPLVKDAKATANWLRDNIAAFETLKLRERQRLEAERRRAEQERLAEEERARETARLALEAGMPVVVPPTPAPLPPPPPAPETTLKGNYGRAATIGVEKVVAEITHPAVLYDFLRDHPDLKACMLNLAQRAVKAGLDVPGIRVEERAKIS